MKNPFPGKLVAYKPPERTSWTLRGEDLKPPGLTSERQATYAADAINQHDELEAERDALLERNKKLVIAVLGAQHIMEELKSPLLAREFAALIAEEED